MMVFKKRLSISGRVVYNDTRVKRPCMICLHVQQGKEDFYAGK